MTNLRANSARAGDRSIKTGSSTQGFRPSTAASSAAEALELVRSTLPDVLISDVGMPGEDGISLIRKIRALPKAEGGRTRAVALTAYARMEDRSEAMLAGFNMHVPKPIQAAELLAALANVAPRR